ncbi:hypothetical protein [Mucilaginibacter glaciei]|uniref:Uncharacterized protein n=1 Tax=Mucilaginibacter glaciei TaxID=2772109 RepID=A0A926NRV6_9SPHI|nr:hypothetical protein [Mucilaginibacter glaciei]MBD1394891.1 hypothetical protein [Mucilaginibacter glaciei]
MKTILLIIFALFFSLTAKSQYFKLNHGVYTIAPQAAKKLTKAEIANFITNDYKHSQIISKNELVYQSNHLLISYWDLFTNVEFRKSLEQIQKSMVNLLTNSEVSLKGTKITISKIITVNGTRYLILEYQMDDEVFLRFSSETKENGVNFNGIIQFKKPYEDEAQRALAEILPTIKFKIN